jgi:hypothetical protein
MAFPLSLFNVFYPDLEFKGWDGKSRVGGRVVGWGEVVWIHGIGLWKRFLKIVVTDYRPIRKSQGFADKSFFFRGLLRFCQLRLKIPHSTGRKFLSPRQVLVYSFSLYETRGGAGTGLAPRFYPWIGLMDLLCLRKLITNASVCLVRPERQPR